MIELASPAERPILADFLPGLARFCADRLGPGQAEAIDAAARIPEALLAELGEMGLFGLTLPEEHGGAGLGIGAACAAVATLARFDRAVATTVGLHLGLGTRGLVALGTPEARAALLPDLAAGTRIAAFAATEAEAGSDLSALRATLRPDGEGWRLDGSKVYVTNGGFAGVFTVLARAPGLGGRRRGTALVVVERERPGLHVGGEEHKLGLRGSSTTGLVLDGVPVERERILGEPGLGMEAAHAVLAWGRTLMAAGAAGMARAALDRTLAHVQARVQFGRPLAALPVVREQLADLLAREFLARAVVARSAATGAAPLPSLAAKVLASEAAWAVADGAIQLHGGAGYLVESGLPLILRDARITRIFEGANDVLRVRAGTLVATREPEPPVPAEDPAGARVAAVVEALRAARADLLARHRLRLLRRPVLLHALGERALEAEAARAVADLAADLGTEEARALALRALDRLARRSRRPLREADADDPVLAAILEPALARSAP